MKTFYVKSRRTSPLLYSEVQAETRDDAIHAAILACPPGDEIEVLQAQEVPYVLADGSSPTGTTGASGASGATGGAMSASRPNRAQLNDMTKEDLLAYAETQEVEVNQHWTKADIIDAIVKHK